VIGHPLGPWAGKPGTVTASRDNGAPGSMSNPLQGRHDPGSDDDGGSSGATPSPGAVDHGGGSSDGASGADAESPHRRDENLASALAGPTREEAMALLDSLRAHHEARGTSEAAEVAVEWMRSLKPGGDPPRRVHTYGITAADMGLADSAEQMLTGFLNFAHSRGLSVSDAVASIDFYKRTLRANHGALTPLRRK
jgi:hypothetical protein